MMWWNKRPVEVDTIIETAYAVLVFKLDIYGKSHTSAWVARDAETALALSSKIKKDKRYAGYTVSVDKVQVLSECPSEL